MRYIEKGTGDETRRHLGTLAKPSATYFANVGSASVTTRRALVGPPIPQPLLQTALPI